MMPQRRPVWRRAASSLEIKYDISILASARKCRVRYICMQVLVVYSRFRSLDVSEYPTLFFAWQLSLREETGFLTLTGLY
jgi:hypothetical protein